MYIVSISYSRLLYDLQHVFIFVISALEMHHTVCDMSMISNKVFVCEVSRDRGTSSSKLSSSKFASAPEPQPH